MTLQDGRPPAAEPPRPLSPAWLAERPRLAPVVGFAAGLLAGWLVLGLWLAPVRWDAAEPFHLKPRWQADWVQWVAEDYQNNGDLGLVSERLASFDAATLRELMAGLAADPGQSAARREHVATLQSNLEGRGLLRAAEGPSPAAAGEEAPVALPGGFGREGLLRILAIAVAIGALGGLAFLAGGQFLRRVRETAGRDQIRSLPGAGGLVSGARPGPAVADDIVPGAARAARAATQDDAMSRTQGMPAVTLGSPYAPPPAAPPPTGPAAAASGRAAPAWRPSRLEVDQTIDARYQEGDTQPILTWLVYNSRGALVGGAGLLAQPIGGVNTLDLWFSDRDDVDQTRKTPTVTFVTSQVYEDPVLRARLSDRRLIPAQPGRRLRLETQELWLDVEVIAVDPPQAEGHPSLRGLVLALSPHHRLDLGTGRLPAQADPAAEADWDVGLDQDIDEAFEPPRPLPFRRD